MKSTLVAIALALNGGLAFAHSGGLEPEGVKGTAPGTVAVAAAQPRRHAKSKVPRPSRVRASTRIYKDVFSGGPFDCRYGLTARQALDRCKAASKTDLLNHHRPLSDQLAARPGAVASTREPFIALAKATEEPPAALGESPVSYVRRYDEKGRKVHELWIHAGFELK
jgi:hypothetical protein